MMVRIAPIPGLDRSQTTSARPARPAAAAVAWNPAIDLYEDADQFVLYAELPGLNREDIGLHLENRILTLSGERRIEKGHQAEKYHLLERPYGRFLRAFTLPSSVAQDRIRATFTDGVLKIELPKSDESRPKFIPINREEPVAG